MRLLLPGTEHIVRILVRVKVKLVELGHAELVMLLYGENDFKLKHFLAVGHRL
jgi:hypothetical protein